MPATCHGPLRGSAVAVLLAICACSGSTPASPTQTTTPFTVSRASLIGPASSYTGQCPVQVTFFATIYGQVPKSGFYQYTYAWQREDGQTSAATTSTISLQSLVNLLPFTFSYSDTPYALTIGQTTVGSLRLHVSAPNDIVSDPATFAVTCVPAANAGD
jgi:hypothetical protein